MVRSMGDAVLKIGSTFLKQAFMTAFVSGAGFASGSWAVDSIKRRIRNKERTDS
jgi:hypothetical protein